MLYFLIGIPGETCCDREGNLFTDFIESELNHEVLVRSVKMGDTNDDDFARSLTLHPFDQVRTFLRFKEEILIELIWFAFRSTLCARSLRKIQNFVTDTTPSDFLRELCSCKFCSVWARSEISSSQSV